MKPKASVTAEIIEIGNSKGVRIPKAIREQAGLEGKVTLSVEAGAVIIRAAQKPRQEWAKAFARAGLAEKDEAIWSADLSNEFDEAEWTW
jgi:antitoxin MazE